ncbi:MAG TPA: CaiB/BaiF CoA-transferase family protein [Acidimicrobiales bacterium]|nr:CaiB/BaiF CoA-transferase family protein [Acidimicrobiales bacterium]
MARPLEGLRVIDVGTRIGAPFCAGLLGEWGADVIKVEQPRVGDFMRTIGPFVDGYSLFWAVEGRGRKSVTCDLRSPEGQDLFRRLASTADVLCENFRPGTMEEWGLGPAALDPRLVFVRISAFGQDGPYSGRPGLDRLGVAYGGLLNLTGEADRPPVRPGVTVADHLTGVFAAEAALAALYRRDTTGTGTGTGTGGGAVIDASLYGSVLRILEWTIPAYDRLGRIRGREGNRLSNSAPLDNYPTADGNYVCVVAGGDANFARLCRAMGRLDLLEDPRFTTLADRARNGDTINALVAQWTSTQSAAEVEGACVAHDVPVATAYNARDIALDPHFEARHDLVAVDDPVLGPIRQQSPYPRLVGETAPVPSGAPTLGADNHQVWCDLVGLSSSELEDLRAKGIV